MWSTDRKKANEPVSASGGVRVCFYPALTLGIRFCRQVCSVDIAGIPEGEEPVLVFYCFFICIQDDVP